MELEEIYENAENFDSKDRTGPRIQNHSRDEGKDQTSRGSVCLVLMTVCLGVICVVLLISIILQFIIITAERDLVKSYKNTFEEFNQTINSLQNNYTDLMTEKYQLNNRFNSLNQKKLELETKVNDLTAEKNQIQNNLNSLSQKKVELEKNVTFLSEELKKTTSNRRFFIISDEFKSWTESRQFCRDRGADLIIINTEEKQRFISSFSKDIVWIGLSDTEYEGRMKWVDNSGLNRGFWESNEPNNTGGNEDCVELNPAKPVLNNWNDIPCSEKRKCICEK